MISDKGGAPLPIVLLSDSKACDEPKEADGAKGGAGGRGLHSSPSQLNLSRFCHRNSMKPPSVSHKSAHDKPKSGRV